MHSLSERKILLNRKTTDNSSTYFEYIGFLGLGINVVRLSPSSSHKDEHIDLIERSLSPIQFEQCDLILLKSIFQVQVSLSR
jgi:hypothetical protein